MKARHLIIAPLAYLSLSLAAVAQETAEAAKMETAGTRQAEQAKLAEENPEAAKERLVRRERFLAERRAKEAETAKMDAAKLEAAQAAKPSGKESPVQSAARPYDLDIAAPVMLAGSDEASAIFQKEVLPGMLDLVNKNLGESQSKDLKAVGAMAFDPSKLLLSYDATARVYFLGEGAGYLNTLGFSTTGGSPLSKDAALIFPNASSAEGAVNSGGKDLRSSEEPLMPGDFVDLGKFRAGTMLDFFLIAQGALGGKEFYSTADSLNADGIVHVVSFALPGSPYLIIGFEDLSGGGDRDFNDLVFAIDIGKANIDHLTGVGAPEPSLAAGGLFAAAALLGLTRRRSA